MSLELKAPSRLKPLGEHATSSCVQKVHAWLEFCEQEGWVRSVSTKQKCKRNQGEKKDKQMPVEELVGRGSGKRLTHFGEVFVVWGIWRVFFFHLSGSFWNVRHRQWAFRMDRWFWRGRALRMNSASKLAGTEQDLSVCQQASRHRQSPCLMP